MLDFLTSVPAWLVLVLLGLSICAESGFIAGMVLPGTTAVLALGAMVGLGVVPALPAYLVGIAAAVAGPTLGWRVGRTGGPTVRQSRLGQFVGDRRWATADRVVAQRGSTAVVFAQFVVVARTLVPLLNGMAGTPYRRFAMFSVPTAAIWSAALMALGQAAGSSLAAATAALGNASVSVGILAGVVVGLAWVGQLFARNQHWGSHPAAESGRRSLTRIQHAVERPILRLVGARAEPVVTATFWLFAAVLLGIVVTVVLVFAVVRTPLRGVDPAVTAWFSAHTSAHVEAAAAAYGSVLQSWNVLPVSYVVAAVLAVLVGRRYGPAQRSRIIVTTLGLVALAMATGFVSDHLVAAAEAGRVGVPHVDQQVAVVPCALALMVILAAPWVNWELRVALWTLVAVLSTMLVASLLVTGTRTLSEAVIALAVSVAWIVMVGSAVRQREPVAAQGPVSVPAGP